MLIKYFSQNEKFIVDNKNNGQGRTPNKIMEIQLEEECDLIINGLKSLGYDVQDNDVIEENKESSINREGGIDINATIVKTKKIIDAILMANDNVVIKAGTKIKNTCRDTERNKQITKYIIETLKMSGSIKNNGDFVDYDITFLKDVHFKKPSTAGYLIAGGHNNGWFVWKDKNGDVIDKYRK